MKDFVRFAKALSDSTRVRILMMLREGEVCVCEIVDALGVPQSSLSTHLQTLRQAGMVKVTKRGTWAYHSLEEWAIPLLDSLVQEFKIGEDEAIQRDRSNLQVRLAMRECGCCVVGSGGLIQLGGKR